MSNLLLYRISGWIQIFIWLIIVGLLVKKQFPQKKLFKYFYIFLILITALELVYMTMALLKTNNLFLDYFYKTTEFIFLGFFLQSISKSKKLLIVNIIVTISFIFFQLTNAFGKIGYQQYNDYGNLINNLYLFIFSFGVLLFLLRKNDVDNLLNKPVFNFILAIFLIYLTNILADFVLKYAYQQRNTMAQFLILISQNLFKSLYLLLFLRGILLIKR